MVRRNSPIVVKLKPEEKEKLKELAEKNNMSISEYVRKKIFKK